MMERIRVKNSPSAYREAVASIYETNDLSTQFFSQENVAYLQTAVNDEVYRRTQRQFQPSLNLMDLKGIMRSLYLEHAKDTDQLQYLNQKVLDHCVPIVYNESVAYVKFIRDQNYLPMPLMAPLQPDRIYRDLDMSSTFF